MRNPAMNFGLLFETLLGAFLCYSPVSVALGTRPLRLTHWFPGMPFSVLIFLYDETRKVTTPPHPTHPHTCLIQVCPTDFFYLYFCVLNNYLFIIFSFSLSLQALMRKTSIPVKDEKTGREYRIPGWLERNTYY